MVFVLEDPSGSYCRVMKEKRRLEDVWVGLLGVTVAVHDDSLDEDESKWDG